MKNQNTQTQVGMNRTAAAARQAAKQAAWQQAAQGYAISTAKPVANWYIRD